MRPNRRLIALLMALLLLLSLFAGCAQTAQEPEGGADPTPEAVQTPDEETPEDGGEEQAASGTREIVDMAGRTVVVPNEIESVFSTGPVAGI